MASSEVIQNKRENDPRGDLERSWRALLEYLHQNQIDLAFLKSLHQFRHCLESYLSSVAQYSFSQEDLFKLYADLDKVTNLSPMQKTTLDKMDEIAIKMSDYSRNPEKFSGENNATADQFNQALSTLNILCAMVSKTLDIKNKDRIKHVRDNDMAIPKDFFSYLEYPALVEKSKKLLPLIKSIIDSRDFWKSRSLTGITGLEKNATFANE